MNSFEKPQNLNSKKAYKDLTELEKANRYGKKFALQKDNYVLTEKDITECERITAERMEELKEKRRTRNKRSKD